MIESRPSKLFCILSKLLHGWSERVPSILMLVLCGIWSGKSPCNTNDGVPRYPALCCLGSSLGNGDPEVRENLFPQTHILLTAQYHLKRHRLLRKHGLQAALQDSLKGTGHHLSNGVSANRALTAMVQTAVAAPLSRCLGTKEKGFNVQGILMPVWLDCNEGGG